MNKIQMFLKARYPTGSFYATLQTFLKKRSKKGLSRHTVARLYYNLYPIGKKLENPPINIMTRKWLTQYVDELWLYYAPDTIRTQIGDIRQFFKWCKKRNYLPRNIAKRIKPIHRRRRHTKAAPEADIKKVMEYLANQLKTPGLVYRDLFFKPQVTSKGWSYKTIKILRNLFIITFLYETGARVGELAKLSTKAMNKAIERPSNAYMITVVGKSRDRDYFFTERTAELWRMWLQVRPTEYREYAIIGWGNGHQPAPFRTNGISNLIARLCKKAGVRPFRAHALRHAKVKRCRKELGLEMASMLVDHSSLDTTRGYANVDRDELAEAAAKTGVKFDIWEV